MPDDLLASFPLGWEGVSDWGWGGLGHASVRVAVHGRGRVARGAVLVRSAEPGGEVAGDGGEAGGWRVEALDDAASSARTAIGDRSLNRPC